MIAFVSTPPARGFRDADTFDRMVRIIRAEFIEMPGMRLTRPQCKRLWHLSDTDCDRMLTHLVAEGFLVERDDCVSRPAEY